MIPRFFKVVVIVYPISHADKSCRSHCRPLIIPDSKERHALIHVLAASRVTASSNVDNNLNVAPSLSIAYLWRQNQYPKIGWLSAIRYESGFQKKTIAEQEVKMLVQLEFTLSCDKN